MKFDEKSLHYINLICVTFLFCTRKFDGLKRGKNEPIFTINDPRNYLNFAFKEVDSF